MKARRTFIHEIPLYMMLAPAIVLVLIYSYAPMAGIVMAFQRVLPGKGLFGSPWVGLANFKFVAEMPTILQVVWNTIRIAGLKAIAGVVVPVTVALMLNNVTSRAFKRTVQTVIYLPYFLSWIIMAGILVEILSPSDGIVNQALGLAGLKPVFFLGNDKAFPWTMVVTDVWKTFGFGTIVYLASLTDIDPTTQGNTTSVLSQLRTKEWALPFTLRFGVAYEVVRSEQNSVTVTGDYKHPNSDNESLNGGIEYSFNHLLFLRAGYQNLLVRDSEEGLTLGIGLEYGQIAVDYSYMGMRHLGYVQQFGARLRF